MNEVTPEAVCDVQARIKEKYKPRNVKLTVIQLNAFYVTHQMFVELKFNLSVETCSTDLKTNINFRSKTLISQS